MLNGTDAAVRQFVEANRCIVIDWRSSEEEVLESVEQWLPEEVFDFDVGETDTGDCAVTLRFKERQETFTLPPRPQNCFRLLISIDRFLQPEYTIKLFRCTEGDDTHGFLLRPAEWWTVYQKEYSQRSAETFSDLKTLNTLWELDSAPMPLSDAPSKPAKKPWWRRL